MSQRLFLALFVVLVTLTFSGCAKCDPVIEYVDRPIEVLVPQKCIVPKVSCDWSGTDSETIVGMYECIVIQKESIKVCQ